MSIGGFGSVEGDPASSPVPADPSRRFAWTTDLHIGPPGYYETREDGSIDPSVAYVWVDHHPEDLEDPEGHFEVSPHQYDRRVTEVPGPSSPPKSEQPVQPEPWPGEAGSPRIVPLAAQAHGNASLSAGARIKNALRIVYHLGRS